MFLRTNTVFICIFLLFLPLSAGLACYYCASGLPGCNDPFNATAYNVTNVSSVTNTYCVKTMASPGVISRYGSRTCNNVPFIGDEGTACCQTNLCNDVQSIYQIPIPLFFIFFIIFFNFERVFF